MGIIVLFCLVKVEGGRTICPQSTHFTVTDPSNPDAKETCRICPKCPPGQGLPIQCGSKVPNGTSTDCKSCKAKTYSDSYDSSHCKSCSDCGSKTVLQQCTPFQNSKCGTCPPGHFLQPLTDECKECYFCCDDVTESDYLQECKNLGMPKNKRCHKTDANEKCKKEATFAPRNKSTAASSTVPTAVPSLSGKRKTPIYSTANTSVPVSGTATNMNSSDKDPGKSKWYFVGISCVVVAVIITVIVFLVIMVYKTVKRKRSTCTCRRSSYEGAERGNIIISIIIFHILDF